ncbi:MAG TPA: hypothetical protein VMA74_14345 [Dyella sp.]|uniref:hypothetical protein n=1 Tax=Dyella sp. TaxID=1869338 RepID=UPI002C0B2CB3|nr:hypothetical protein [Dyella sp.]HUB90901.1 hypothetical protein [Dyella sp.]
MQAKFKYVLLAGLISAACVPAAFAAQPDNVLGQTDQQVGPIEALARQAWRENMAQIATPSEGCFEADYPSILWQQVACKQLTPRVHTLPARVRQMHLQPQTAGNGDDYVMQAPGSDLISKTVGSFPTVTGVTSEQGVGVASYGGGGILGANEYSLQINSQFTSTTAACKSHSGCTVWQQFVYAPDYETQGEAAGFMQYWLIGYGSSRCPSGWGSDGSGDCYRNSSYVSVPDVPATSLASLSVTGAAVSGGNDTITVTYSGKAYSASGKDSVVDLASVWHQSEFNVVGNAGGSEAEFNSGSSITVRVAGTYGSTSAPTCVADDGSTGESNNLNLGSCSAVSGSSPYIQFTESN